MEPVQELTHEPIQDEDWRLTLHKRQRAQLVEDGYIQVDSDGNETLTVKGEKRVANRMDKLPPGEDQLIELAVLTAHGITVRN